MQRSLGITSGPPTGVLDVLLQAGHQLTGAADLPDALTRIAELCVARFACWCAIKVSVEALDRYEFETAAGIPAGQPADPQRRVTEKLEAGRASFGTIVCETDDPAGFDEATRRLVQVLALQIAMVVSGQASRLREHRVADRFQRALLPHQLPSLPGAAFYASYRPASQEAEVGGDWYDAFPISDGRMAISVGDVAGHGLDAAVIMGEVRQAMRAAAVGTGATPSAVLEYVNDVVQLREAFGMVTAVFALYDPATSELAYASAGHPAPLLSLAGGVTRRLPFGGVPLGSASSVESPTWTFTIPAGGRVVFYTDGFIENERDVIRGEERLIDVVRGLQFDPAEDPAAALQQRIFDGTANRDDAAVLVLDRTDPVRAYVFSAQPVVSPLARAIVEREMSRLALSEDKRFGVLVAVGEAVANAVEHAYRGTEPGLIRMEIGIDSVQLVLTIEDFGRWRPFVRREERGRGIELMHAFTDGVQIKSTRESTSIVLRTRLGESAME